MSVSIVIPALDAAAELPATLAALDEGRARDLLREIVLADGGSRDATSRIAENAGARVVKTAKGRGPQLAAGAQAAAGDWLLFLHADSRLDPGWSAAVQRFIEAPENADRAGFFRLAFDAQSGAAQRVGRLANWRARRLGLPYGDQGLLIARSFYDALGGFRPLALMEDVDLVRRIGRRRLLELDARVVTSAARYHEGGWWAVPLRNLCLLSAYLAGVPPAILARLYR